MKRLLQISVMMALFTLALPNRSVAQCNDELLEEPAALLEKFTYLRDFKIRMKKAKKNQLAPTAAYSVILNKGTKYRFITNSDASQDGQVIMELFDRKVEPSSSEYHFPFEACIYLPTIYL